VDQVSDQEQVEVVKRWLRENGTTVIVGVLIGVAAIFGWRTWQNYKQAHAEEASAEYQTLIEGMAQRRNTPGVDLEGLIRRGERLVAEYKMTPYASLASLTLATLSLEQGKKEATRAYLQWVIDHGDPLEVQKIARLRLARLLLVEGETNAALALLEAGDAGEFSAAYEELRGDIYRAQGDREKARNAYLKALATVKLKGGPQLRMLLQMKMDDLGGQGAEEPVL
jgi:Uncharacterized protein conserved in bacteria